MPGFNLSFASLNLRMQFRQSSLAGLNMQKQHSAWQKNMIRHAHRTEQHFDVAARIAFVPIFEVSCVQYIMCNTQCHCQCPAILLIFAIFYFLNHDSAFSGQKVGGKFLILFLHSLMYILFLHLHTQLTKSSAQSTKQTVCSLFPSCAILILNQLSNIYCNLIKQKSISRCIIL